MFSQDINEDSRHKTWIRPWRCDTGLRAM